MSTIRCIQRGTVTLQGPLRGEPQMLCVRYERGLPVMKPFGTILTGLGAVWGQLIESTTAHQRRVQEIRDAMINAADITPEMLGIRQQGS